MRAVLTTAHGDRDVLEWRDDIPIPQLGTDEAIVRVAACALNFHDIFTRRGMPGINIPMPIIVGSDIAGQVVSVGARVSGWRPGDRVLVDPVIIGGARPEMIGETRDGGRAELVAVPAAQLVAVPDPVDLVGAAALPLAYGTAYKMLIRRGRIAAGETILILGASGGVGVACVQLAKIWGLQVIACVGSAEKAERLRAIGADEVIDYTTNDFVAEVRRLRGKPRVADGSGGVDVAVNFTGGDTFAATQRCVRLGGRILCCGATAGYAVDMDARYLWTFEHEIIGSDGWARKDLEALLDLMAAGQLKPVVDIELPLDRVAEGERLLEERRVVGKIVFRP